MPISKPEGNCPATKKGKCDTYGELAGHFCEDQPYHSGDHMCICGYEWS